MDLSNDLVSQFAKITTGDKNKNNETTVYGTVKIYDGVTCVKIDGSDLLTPVDTTTEVKEGERVTVLIKNHSAVITGNTSDPSASVSTTDGISSNVTEIVADIGEFKELTAENLEVTNAKIENLTAKDAEIENLVASKASIEELEATNAKIENLTAKDAEIENLVASKASIEELEAVEAKIEDLDVEFISAEMANINDALIQKADIKDLDATNAQIMNLQADNAKLNEAIIQKADVTQLEATWADIDSLEADIAEIDTALIDKASIDDLNAVRAEISDLDVTQLEATVADINTALIYKANVEDLEATNADIGSLRADTARIDEALITKASIDDLNATNAKIDNLGVDDLEASVIKVENALANKAEINDLNAVNADIESLEADIAEIDTALIDKASIDDLNAINASIDNLETDVAKIDEALINKASVDDLNATNATIEDLTARVGTINDAMIGKASIEELEAVEAKIEDLDVDILRADVADIEQALINKADVADLNAANADIDILNAQVADIETLVGGNLTMDNMQSLNLTSSKVTVDDAFIKDAMIDSVTASKIISGSIDTNKVTITSTDGSMTLTGSVQQFKDENGNVRIQIGKDSGGNFSFILYDSTGKGVLIDEDGIKSSNAIADGLIVDSKVADNANIAGSKLNIASVISAVNNDSSTTIKSNKIFLDEQNQSLEVAFNSLKTQVDTIQDVTIDGDLTSIVEQVQSNTTQINVNKGNISTLTSENTIRKEEIKDLEDNIESVSTSMNDKYTSLQQDLSGFKTTVGETYTTKEDVQNEIDAVNNNLTTNYSTTSAMNSAINQKANEITNTVSETYATKSSVDDVNNNLTTNYSTTAQMNSAVTQKANEITNAVSQTYATKSDVDEQIYSTESKIDQTADALITTFASSGGYNLLRNSTGNNATSNQWYTDADSLETGSNDSPFGSPTRYYLRMTNDSTSECRAMSARFRLKPNTTYRFTGYFHNYTSCSSFDVYVLGSTTIAEIDTAKGYDSDHVYKIISGTTTKGQWVKYSVTFTTKADIRTGYLRIDHNGYDSSGTGSPSLHWSAISLTKGEAEVPWSPHPDEVYSGVTTIDANGVLVKQTGYNGHTHMSASGFYVNDGTIDAVKITKDGAVFTGKMVVQSGSTVPTNVLSGTVTSSQLDSAVTTDISTAKTNASTALSTANTAKSTADSVKSTVDDSKTNWDNAYKRVKEWAYGAVTESTTIDGGLIQTNTIFSNKIAISDFTNYNRLCTANANAAGWDYYTSDDTRIWYRRVAGGKLVRHNQTDITGKWIDCQGGGSFRVKAYIANKVFGKTSSDGSGSVVGLGANICITYIDDTGAQKYLHTPNAGASSSEDSFYFSTIDSVLTVPSNAKRMQVHVFIIGYYFISGEICISDFSVTKMSSGELIVDGAITADKIASNAVTTDKLNANAVTAAKISSGAITTEKLEAKAVTAAKIAANTITASQIAANTITADQIKAGTITADELASNAVTTDKLKANAVTAAKIASNAVTTDKLEANAVTAAKIAANSIEARHMMIGDYTNYSQLQKGQNLTNSYGTATWVVDSNDANNCYWQTTDTYFPLTTDGTPNPFVTGDDNVQFKFDAYVTVEATKTVGVWFYSDTNNSNYLVSATANVTLKTGWNSYVVDINNFTSAQIKRAKSIAILMNNVNKDGLALRNVVVRRKVAGELIVDGAITADKIASNAVTTDKLKANAVTAAKISSGAITTEKLEAKAVTAAKIAANTITASQIAANTITADQIKAGTITADELASNAVTTDKIAAGAITTSKLAVTDGTNYAQLTSKMAATWGWTEEIDSADPYNPWFNRNTVTRDNRISEFYPCKGGETLRVSAEIYTSVYGQTVQNGTDTATAMQVGVMIFTRDLNNVRSYKQSARVTASSTSGTTSSISSVITLPTSARQFAVYIQINGYPTFSGALKVRNVIVNKMASGELIVDGAITTDKLAANAVTAAKIAANTITADQIKAGTITADELASNAITTAKLAANAVTAAKIAANTITADQIAAGTITADELASNAVTTAKLAANAVTAAKIAANTITASQIKAGTITATQIAANTITAAKIAANTITADQIAAGTITADELASNAITTAKLAANAVTAAKIAANTITASQIKANTITATQIAAGTITADELAAGAITADKIAAGAITADMINGGTLSAADEINFVGGARIFGNTGEAGAGLTISASTYSFSGASNGYLHGNWHVLSAADDSDGQLTVEGNLTAESHSYLNGTVWGGGAIYAGDDYSIVITNGNLYTATGTAYRDYIRIGGNILTSDSANSGYFYILTTAGAFASIRANAGKFGGNVSCYDVNASNKVYANNVALTSDRTLKTDIRYVDYESQSIGDSGLIAPNVNITTRDMHTFIETLPMASYRMIAEVDKGIDYTYYGFIAQDILYSKVGSELIEIGTLKETIETEDEEGKIIETTTEREILRYSENKFIAFLAGALKEEIYQRKELERKLDELRTIVNDISNLNN